MQCYACGQERVIWLMHPVRNPAYPKNVNYNMYKCYRCFGFNISRAEQKIYNVDEKGNYLGNDNDI